MTVRVTFLEKSVISLGTRLHLFKIFHSVMPSSHHQDSDIFWQWWWRQNKFWVSLLDLLLQYNIFPLTFIAVLRRKSLYSALCILLYSQANGLRWNKDGIPASPCPIIIWSFSLSSHMLFYLSAFLTSQLKQKGYIWNSPFLKGFMHLLPSKRPEMLNTFVCKIIFCVSS